MMQRHMVTTSSNVVCISYDAETQTLEVEFKGGGTYRYHLVPPDVFQQFLAADSKGKYFIAHVRGIYPSERL